MPEAMKTPTKAGSQPPSSPRGFTLIELLVVIAILAILMVILIPVVKNARINAQTAGSMSNLKQIYVLINNYLANTAGTYPEAVEHGINTEWRRSVWESSYGVFTGSPPEVMKAMGGAYAKTMWCPLLVGRYGQDQHPVGRGSYSINWFFRNYNWGGQVRKIGHLNLIGKQEPFIVAGSVLPGSPMFGTYAQFESSLENYGDGWKSVGYEYGKNKDAALAMFLDGSVKKISKPDAIELNPLISNAANLD